MEIQSKVWGTIQWLHTSEPNSNKQSINVGITTILPGQTLNMHTHYGEEQMLHVMEGEGIYIIGGVPHHFKPGMTFYMEAGTEHMSVNTGTVPVKELLVSNPVPYSLHTPLLLEAEKFGEKSNAEKINLCASVESVRTRVLDPLNIPFSIYDDQMQLIYKSSICPPFCQTCCSAFPECMSPSFDNGTCLSVTDCRKRLCPHGMTILEVPIFFQQEPIGTIQGGYIWETESHVEIPAGEYDSSYTAVKGLISLLRQIAETISTFCVFNLSHSKIEAQRLDIERETYSNLQLASSLQRVEQKVTNLKIDHHFLFNILTSFGKMALEANSIELYRSIVALSRMLRYPMRSQDTPVPLSQEIDYVKCYLDLQKNRWKELCVSYDLNNADLTAHVPFNFLQPIVENAFTHGFKDIGEQIQKTITIRVFDDREDICIDVSNSGSPIPAGTLRRINRSIMSKNGHGLSFIYEKFHRIYGDSFSLQIHSVKAKGTVVHIRFPRRS